MEYKQVFDLNDHSWTWSDLADAINKRYSRTDREELLFALISKDKDIIPLILQWDIIEEAMK